MSVIPEGTQRKKPRLTRSRNVAGKKSRSVCKVEFGDVSADPIQFNSIDQSLTSTSDHKQPTHGMNTERSGITGGRS